jgi:hypothetical protein
MHTHTHTHSAGDETFPVWKREEKGKGVRSPGVLSTSTNIPEEGRVVDSVLEAMVKTPWLSQI